MYIICENAGEFHETVYTIILVKGGGTSVSTFLNSEFRHFRYNSNYLPQIQINSVDMRYVLYISIYRRPNAYKCFILNRPQSEEFSFKNVLNLKDSEASKTFLNLFQLSWAPN